MNVARFRELPIMAILRGIKASQVPPLFQAIRDAGLQTVEITMNTAGAPSLIRQAVKLSGKKLMIGAGTVLDLKSLKTALDAGATFIVMPVVVPKVVSYCVRHKIPVFPGALCPQEVFHAWEAGATMVKVFPAGLLGPAYFKELKGPFDKIELMACSGVKPKNLPAYFKSGASAVTVGGSVFSKERLDAGSFNAICDRLREYVMAYRTLNP